MTTRNAPRRVLAIKLADLGDLLLCEPAFRSLRTAFSDARIDVLTTPSSAALLSLIGHDLRAVAFPKHLFDVPSAVTNPLNARHAASLAVRLRVARYDRVVVLHHLTTAFGARKFGALVRATGCSFVAGLDNGRGTFLTHRVDDLGFGARHEAEYVRDIAVAAGGAAVEAVPTVAVPAQRVSVYPLPTPYAAIFPATGPYSNAREWPAVRFGAIATALRRLGVPSVIIGGDDARAAAGIIRAIEPSAIDITGRTSLEELAVVLHRARLVVGGDSFIGHLAAALGRPVVSIFGPSNADAWRPAGAIDASTPSPVFGRSLVVRHDLPCMPCLYTGFRLGRPQGCPDRTCLKLVTVDDVVTAVTRALGVSP
ncbi:MAG: glycosyltransferase family 9 protein [Thermomicrobiales bacterium]